MDYLISLASCYKNYTGSYLMFIVIWKTSVNKPATCVAIEANESNQS